MKPPPPRRGLVANHEMRRPKRQPSRSGAFRASCPAFARPDPHRPRRAPTEETDLNPLHPLHPQKVKKRKVICFFFFFGAAVESVTSSRSGGCCTQTATSTSDGTEIKFQKKKKFHPFRSRTFRADPFPIKVRTLRK